MISSSRKKGKFAVVVTSIAEPNRVMRALAHGCIEKQHEFIVIGDVSSPLVFHLDGCSYYDIDHQLAAGFDMGALLPTRHYARKNIGYLLAMQTHPDAIVETDDDNFPRASFWEPRTQIASHRCLSGGGWVNAYKYFTNSQIWPRGLPLDAISAPIEDMERLPLRQTDCPIQQGLADENPDVDAIYRLILPLPVTFSNGDSIALSNGSWCPFNSQNTTWFPAAYPLLYLPSYCSFRMTDIWRSLIAQRIAWENQWSVLFHEATVWQERNSHNLMKDFADEVPGYLHNRAIAVKLENLTLRPGLDRLGDNLLICYEALISLGVMERREISLLLAWLSDLSSVMKSAEGVGSGCNERPA